MTELASQHDLPVRINDVFTTPWGENVDIVHDEELEQWLREHHIGDDIFAEFGKRGEDGQYGPWSFDLGPFTIEVSVSINGSVYTYTATLYFKKFGIKKKLLTFTFSIDTAKGSASYCYDVNVVGIVKGKICLLYENKTFYLYFKLEGFGKTWEKKIKLFSI